MCNNKRFLVGNYINDNTIELSFVDDTSFLNLVEDSNYFLADEYWNNLCDEQKDSLLEFNTINFNINESI